MKLTISEAAKRMNLTPHTIRYYDKEGLLPFVERSETGIRYFKESDLEGLAVINCLKATGMPIREIKTFMDWCVEGDGTLQARYEMFMERRTIALAQMQELKEALERIEYKVWYYKTAMDAGTEKVHDNAPSNLLYGNRSSLKDFSTASNE